MRAGKSGSWNVSLSLRLAVTGVQRGCCVPSSRPAFRKDAAERGAGDQPREGERMGKQQQDPCRREPQSTAPARGWGQGGTVGPKNSDKYTFSNGEQEKKTPNLDSLSRVWWMFGHWEFLNYKKKKKEKEGDSLVER